MKWSLFLGVASALIIWLLALLSRDWSKVDQLSGTIAFVSLLSAGILSGALLSGGRMRTNFQNESKKDRGKRLNFATKLFLIGLPNLVTTVLYVHYFHPLLNR